MHGVSEKAATSSSFTKRVKNTLGKFFLFTMRTGTGDEVDEEDDDNEKIDDYSDLFDAVRTKNTATNGIPNYRELTTTANSDTQTEATRVTKSRTTLRELEAEFEGTSRQRGTARVSTSTKLPVTKKVTPSLLTPLVDDGASIEEVLTRIFDRMGELRYQISIRTNELERTAHVERESLREEIHRKKQEISQSEKHLKKRTDDHEAERRVQRLREDMEQLRNHQEQTLLTFKTRIDAMMEKAIMVRLDGLMGNRSGSRNKVAH